MCPPDYFPVNCQPPTSRRQGYGRQGCQLSSPQSLVVFSRTYLFFNVIMALSASLYSAPVGPTKKLAAKKCGQCPHNWPLHLKSSWAVCPTVISNCLLLSTTTSRGSSMLSNASGETGRMGLRYHPMAFTEQGVAMLSFVLQWILGIFYRRNKSLDHLQLILNNYYRWRKYLVLYTLMVHYNPVLSPRIVKWSVM